MNLRQVTMADVPGLCALLNEIIEIGGTTAFQTPLTEEEFARHYVTAELLVSCVVAEDDGNLLGFQALEWADPNWCGDGALPEDWLIIATFARAGRTKSGIGRAMFAETLKSARKTDATAIDATIRADNTGGLAYYSRMGFVEYGVLRDIPLNDGKLVDRVRKRFDL